MVQRINCRICIHFRVTWDPNRPFGCTLYNLKSKQLPSAVVLSSSGEQCKVFTLRKNTNSTSVSKSNTNKDLTKTISKNKKGLDIKL